MILSCQYCSGSFIPDKSTRRYCSRICADRAQQRQKVCVCAVCKIRFTQKRSTCLRGGGRYCSRTCFYANFKPAIERFWEKVDKKKAAECWPFMGSRDKAGYGWFNASPFCKGQAHRFIFMYLYGPLKPGECVLHRCDHPFCVNPKHLWKGTGLENVADRTKKGRTHSKLTAIQVVEIRKLIMDGLTNPELARQFSISQTTIWRIRCGKAWNHLRLPSVDLLE